MHRPVSYSLSYQNVGYPGDPDFKLQSKSTALSLRPPTCDDIPLVLGILQNKANSQFDKSIAEASTHELEAIARKWTSLSQPLTYLNFLVRYEDAVIGIAGLGWIGAIEGDQTDGDHSRAGAAGVILEPDAREKGYAYEALRMVFDYGLYELGLVEVRVGSHSQNLPMKMLMERKFGFQAERCSAHEGVDQFGNDLLWVVTKEKLNEQAA